MGFIIVPGIYDSGETHWQTLWEKELAAARIRPESWDRPRLADWLRAIDEAVAEQGNDAVFIAHSMGCTAVVEWLNRNPESVGAALLVAPPDPDSAVYPAAAAEFASIARERVRVSALLVGSDDDPYCSATRIVEIGEQWGVELVSAGPNGHLNAASGLGDWPEGRSLLARLLETHARSVAVPQAADAVGAG